MTFPNLEFGLLVGIGGGVPVKTDHGMTVSKLAFNKIIRVLCDHGLVDANHGKSALASQSYIVHDCVHEWMKNVLNQDHNKIMACAVINCIASHVPPESTPEYWLVQRRLLTHADQSFAMRGNAIPQNEDLYAVGYLYESQGRLRDAEVMYRQALEGYQKALGPDNTSTLDIFNSLSTLYTAQGKLEGAEAMFQRALKGQEKA